MAPVVVVISLFTPLFFFFFLRTKVFFTEWISRKLERLRGTRLDGRARKSRLQNVVHQSLRRVTFA